MVSGMLSLGVSSVSLVLYTNRTVLIHTVRVLYPIYVYCVDMITKRLYTYCTSVYI